MPLVCSTKEQVTRNVTSDACIVLCRIVLCTLEPSQSQATAEQSAWNMTAAAALVDCLTCGAEPMSKRGSKPCIR